MFKFFLIAILLSSVCLAGNCPLGLDKLIPKKEQIGLKSKIFWVSLAFIFYVYLLIYFNKLIGINNVSDCPEG